MHLVPGFGTWYPAQCGGTKVPKLDHACDPLGALGKMHTPASPAECPPGQGWGGEKVPVAAHALHQGQAVWQRFQVLVGLCVA